MRLEPSPPAGRDGALASRPLTGWLNSHGLGPRAPEQDQKNIEQSLACLPVFLAGCQQLLIVAGPTYCTRLWCVMEIFTFMHMGGDLERIEILPLSSAPPCQDVKRLSMRGSRDKLKAQFAGFDAAKAQCFLAKDRQRLLAVVEAGFGDFKEFNTRVRSVFAARVLARHLSSFAAV